MLDEPSVGMNLEEREELADLVRGIRDRGTTVLVVDHNLDLVLGVADRVVVLDFGRVLAVGTPDEVIADPRVRAAYIGPIVPSTGVGRAEVGP
jgi:branched-chain amino acid transport system ATP-binding protein